MAVIDNYGLDNYKIDGATNGESVAGYDIGYYLADLNLLTSTTVDKPA